MKKDKIIKNDELRDEYKQSDFPAPLVRGKYAKRLRESSNVIVLKPEVAEAFPQTTTRPTNKNSKISIKN
jgi:hypothetical protein